MKNFNTYITAALAFIVCFAIPAYAIGSNNSFETTLQSTTESVIAEKIESSSNHMSSVDLSADTVKKAKERLASAKQQQENAAQKASIDKQETSIQEEKEDKTSQTQKDTSAESQEVQSSDAAPQADNTGQEAQASNSPTPSQSQTKQQAETQAASTNPQSGSTSTPTPQKSVANEPKVETHTHNPATRWISQPTETWIVDQAAWDEEIPVEHVVAKEMGGNDRVYFENGDDFDAWYFEGTRAADYSYSTIVEYQTIHHDEVGHWETIDNGYNETYCSSCGAIL